MRISICDDEPLELASLCSYIEEYIRCHDFDMEVKCYSSPLQLLEYEEANGTSDVYLLDIIMPDMNGIELGRKIRQRSKKTAILYLTTAKEYSLSAFSVHAFSYLIKPIEKEVLFSELWDCFSILESVPLKVSKVIPIKTPDEMKLIPIKSINAIEYSNHRLIFHLTDGCKTESIYKNEPFNRLAANYMEFGVFVRSAESYLINMDNIASITAKNFRMKNDREYPITRKYDSAKKYYLDYAMNH